MREGTETSTLCPDGQAHTTLSSKLHRRSLLGGFRLSENSGPSHPAPQKTGMTIVTLSGPQSPCLAYALCHQAQGSSKILEACLVLFSTEVSGVKIRSTYQSVQVLSREGRGSSRVLLTGLGSYYSLAAAALLQLLLSRDQLLWLPWGCSASQAPGPGGWRGNDN